MINTTLEYYLKTIEHCWPYNLFHYQEEVALHFLHLKNYDINLALMTALYNKDQLVRLLMGTNSSLNLIKYREREDGLRASSQMLS